MGAGVRPAAARERLAAAPRIPAALLQPLKFRIRICAGGLPPRRAEAGAGVSAVSGAATSAGREAEIGAEIGAEIEAEIGADWSGNETRARARRSHRSGAERNGERWTSFQGDSDCAGRGGEKGS